MAEVTQLPSVGGLEKEPAPGPFPKLSKFPLRGFHLAFP